MFVIRCLSEGQCSFGGVVFAPFRRCRIPNRAGRFSMQQPLSGNTFRRAPVPQRSSIAAARIAVLPHRLFFRFLTPAGHDNRRV
jgi:hypothetical protein